MCGEHLIKWRAFMRTYLIFHERWIWTMDQEEGKFYKRNPLLFILGEVEFASNCCRIVYALWSSFAFAIHFHLA